MLTVVAHTVRLHLMWTASNSLPICNRLYQLHVCICERHPHMIHTGNTFHHVAGYTWTTKHCSDDRALDAGWSVAEAAPNAALLQAICDNQAINRSRKEPETLHTGWQRQRDPDRFYYDSHNTSYKEHNKTSPANEHSRRSTEQRPSLPAPF